MAGIKSPSSSCGLWHKLSSCKVPETGNRQAYFWGEGGEGIVQTVPSQIGKVEAHVWLGIEGEKQSFVWNGPGYSDELAACLRGQQSAKHLVSNAKGPVFLCSCFVMPGGCS